MQTDSLTAKYPPEWKISCCNSSVSGCKGILSVMILLQAGLRQQMQEKAKAGELHSVNGSSASDAQKQAGKRRRWDQAADTGASAAKKKSSWDAAESTAPTPSNSRWDETPGRPKGSDTPGATPSSRQWDATPGHATPGAATPGRDGTPGHQASARKNRWDETPKADRGQCLWDVCLAKLTMYLLCMCVCVFMFWFEFVFYWCACCSVL